MANPHGTFRMRGEQITRIETFTDAAFAFSLTLLVIAFDPMNTFAQLREALENIPPFLASAAMLMMFWWGHHEWSRRYGLDDFVTFLLSCALVCAVLIFVYPLRFVFRLMETWLCMLLRIPLSHGVVVENPDDINGAFIVYGTGFAAMSLILMLLCVHAWRKRDALQLNAFERHETRISIVSWAILAGIGLLSVVLAVVFPPSWFGIPGWAYGLIGVAMSLQHRLMKPPQAAAL